MSVASGGSAFSSSSIRIWAISPVHPVWWLAPQPRPVSPWKYSWNGDQVPPVRVVLEDAAVAEDGRSPFAFLRKIEGHSSADLLGDLVERHRLSDPVGHSTWNVSP